MPCVQERRACQESRHGRDVLHVVQGRGRRRCFYAIPAEEIKSRYHELTSLLIPGKGFPDEAPEGAPTPAEHAVLLAILANEDGEKAKIVSYIKERGWISSDATIYGYQGKPGILEKLVNAGFAAKAESAYRLTEQGKKWVDPEYIMANQSDKLGSEEHKRLMAKTIEKLHEENMLVAASSAKHSPDLISFPVSKAKRYLWDIAGAMGYKIQTSARKEAIEMNEAKTGLPITWITEDEAVLEEIKRLTAQRDSYIPL